MSKAIGDVSTSQMLLGVQVHLELSELLWWRCNHLSQIESCNSLRVISPREVTCEWQVKQDMRALLLTHLLACFSKWRGCSQSITIGYSVRLVFGEPVYIINSKEKFIHISFFTHFNQYLTINSIAALTRAWLKKSWRMRVIPQLPPPAPPLASYDYFFAIKKIEAKKRKETAKVWVCESHVSLSCSLICSCLHLPVLPMYTLPHSQGILYTTSFCFCTSTWSLGRTKCYLSVVSDLKTDRTPCCRQQWSRF